jgi:hypothetical protein
MIKFNNLFVIFLTFILLSSIANAHDSHIHTAPWEACEDMKKSKQCAYTNGDGDLFQGTCQLFSDVLMCVRNQPIIHVKNLAKKIEKAKSEIKINTSQMSEG